MTSRHAIVATVGLALVVAAVVTARQITARIADPQVSLAGDWKYLPDVGNEAYADPAFDDRDWPTMPLPSNWFLKGKKEYPVAIDLSPASGGAAGGNWGDIDKPEPERGLDHSGYVWFRKRVTWPSAPAGPVILRFGMVDYLADVYVNGQRVGHHEGYFEPFAFDVARHVKAGENLITVRVGAPQQIFDWTEQYPVSWPKRQGQLKGIFGYHDTRPGAKTSRGQERSTGGIIGEVTLTASPGVDLLRAEVLPLQVSAQQATIQVDYVLQNWTAQPRRGTIRGVVAPKNFSGGTTDEFTQSVTAAPGESRVRVTRTVNNPQLWWSWDHGKPNLYRLRTTMTNGLEGSHETSFGIRSITRDDNWVWYLNGRRVFPRGTNYISTQWLSQADHAFYTRDFKLLRDANFNSIRVHAHLERPEFYALADEMGFMLWQDFPLQWGYTDSPVFHKEALRQARQMIGLFASHPSIIVWSMHNESPHAMEWMKRRVKDQNLALDEALVAEARKLDPTRVHHRDSGTGDGHPYAGWYSDKVADFVKLPGAPFLNEYGAQALPVPETLRSMFPAAALWPDTNEDWALWAFHNFQKDETFNIAKVPMGKTIEDFTWNSQNYQAALLRFATEGYRRAKWTKVTGIYQFMFVEDWPSITWAVVDYYRRPKRGYHVLAAAMQPVLPSVEYAIDDPEKPLTLWVVNDRHEAFKSARLQWKLGSSAVQSTTIDVPSDGVVRVVTIGSGRDIARGSSKLEVWLEDAAGQPLGRNTLESADFLYWKQ
jgi:beta-mannosidase